MRSLGVIVVTSSAMAEHGAHGRADRIALSERAHPPPSLISAVVALAHDDPGRSKAAALDIRHRRVGIGVDEDIAVVEGRDEPDVLEEEHPVAEDVAAHVPDADDGEVLGLGVRPISRKCRLTDSPRTAGVIPIALWSYPLDRRRRTRRRARTGNPEIRRWRCRRTSPCPYQRRRRDRGRRRRGTVRSGATMSSPTRLSVRSSSPEMKIRYAAIPLSRFLAASSGSCLG